METIYKSKGKFIPIVIDDEVRRRVKSFKDRLKEMSEYDEISTLDKLSVRIILEELDPYDQNILIAYYDYGGSATELGRMLQVSPQVIYSRIKKILKYVANRSNLLTGDNGVHH